MMMYIIFQTEKARDREQKKKKADGTFFLLSLSILHLSRVLCKVQDLTKDESWPCFESDSSLVVPLVQQSCVVYIYRSLLFSVYN